MGRVRQAFSRAREQDRAALIVYLCAGDPHLSLTPRLITAATEAGADIVELGVPFSDPTADGIAIQQASQRALVNGTNMKGVLGAVEKARENTDRPIVLFGYYNPILAYGQARLAKDAAQAGVDGFLTVDLPPEECHDFRASLLEHDLDYVPLVAPTSTVARRQAAAEVATSFIYYVSLTGVTGAAATDLQGAAKQAAQLSRETSCPVAVGFGVKSPEDVSTVAAYADGVVVGSALVRAIAGATRPEEAPEAVRAMVEGLVSGLAREEGR